MRCRSTSMTMLTVIVSSLLFSVGEGLRLSPFPVPGQSRDLYGFVIKPSDKTTVAQYGPLDVPVQPQKRSKRQALDLACPDPGAGRKVVRLPFRYLFEHEAAAKGSLLFIPRPEGRAPPSFS
jgi:hypothetical protein